MLNIKDLSKLLITMSVALTVALAAGISFAEDNSNTVITAVDPATGKVVEAPKLFSEMTVEEKAGYSMEDLKILEEHEAEMKRQAETPKY